MLRIPSPIGPPSTITVVFRSPIFGADLSTVTAVALNVTRQNGTIVTWAATIISATALELVAQYELQTGDISGTGLYTLSPQLTVPGGVLPGNTIAAFVSPTTLPKLEDDCWLAATSAIETTGPIKTTWTVVNAGPYAAVATAPLIALDLRTNAVAVTLWAANDGDAAILSDVYNSASSHNLTLAGNGTAKVPVGDGTYASSTVKSAAFVLRLRYSAALDLWLSW